MSRQVLARVAAVFYILNFVLGGFAFSLARGGPSATSDAVTLAAALDYAMVVLILGYVFELGGRALSWLVASVGLAGCALSAMQSLHFVGAEVNPLAVFGVYCLGLGMLILWSRLMPPLVGVLLVLGGCSWLTFAVPSLAAKLAPANMGPGAIAELIFTFWLLVFGIRDRALSEAGASPPRPARAARS